MTVLALLEILQRFGDPLKRPAKAILLVKAFAEAIVPDKKKPQSVGNLPQTILRFDPLSHHRTHPARRDGPVTIGRAGF